MRSGYVHFSDRNKIRSGKPPSLVDLCVQVAIDNIRYIGDVGATDAHLLERILPHCTLEQLMHIENATAERDLSPITDKLWKKFYEAKFGVEHVKLVIERMSGKRVSFKWRQLYQAKLEDSDKAQKKAVEKLAESFKNADAQKQSRKIQICSKVPPSSKKRSFGGGFGASSSFSNLKGSLMKKAKTEYSTEIKNRVAVKRAAVQMQQTYSVRSTMRPQSTHGKASVSKSKFTKPAN